MSDAPSIEALLACAIGTAQSAFPIPPVKYFITTGVKMFKKRQSSEVPFTGCGWKHIEPNWKACICPEGSFR